MSYLYQSKIANDSVIRDRIAACAASEKIENPFDWAVSKMWELSAEPGWSSAYASASLLYENSPHSSTPPGSNEAAITDGMILSAVQLLKG